MRDLRPERSYPDRIELLGLLAARHPYPAGIADQRAGILQQTEWQERSGRALAGADGRLASWWPTVNWTLTVWQLEALQRRGELGEVVLTTRAPALPDAVAASMLAYYDRLDELAAHPPSEAERRAAKAELQRLLWHFHVRAIEHGLAAAAPELASLPAAEVRFAESWGFCLVGLLAAANVTTDVEHMQGMQHLLPGRLVVAADWGSGAGSDLGDPQRALLSALRALHDSEQASGHRLERRLAALAETPAGARAAARHLFEVISFGAGQAAELLSERLA